MRHRYSSSLRKVAVLALLASLATVIVASQAEAFHRTKRRPVPVHPPGRVGPKLGFPLVQAFGLDASHLKPDQGGIFLDTGAVLAGGPAQALGIEDGDVILDVDGNPDGPLDSVSKLNNALLKAYHNHLASDTPVNGVVFVPIKVLDKNTGNVEDVSAPFQVPDATMLKRKK
jgi:hypothetical protein